MSMKTVPLSEAKNKLSQIIDEVRTRGEAVQIRKRDRDAVVIIKSESYQRLQELEDKVTRYQLKLALKGKMYPLEKVIESLDLE